MSEGSEKLDRNTSETPRKFRENLSEKTPPLKRQILDNPFVGLPGESTWQP